jgi:hypothetical protein
MHRVGRNPMKIPFFAEITFVFDEEPDLTLQDVIDLFGFVLMRFGVISRPSGCDHQTALVAVAFADNHCTRAGFASLISLVFGDIGAFYV